ncbi:MAG TPA: hypothetical protein VGJ45_29365 [Pseudonocardiaceae bacterium]
MHGLHLVRAGPWLHPTGEVQHDRRDHETRVGHEVFNPRTDVSMLVGLAVAAGVYLLVCRSLDVTAEREAVRVADDGLDPDAP